MLSCLRMVLSAAACGLVVFSASFVAHADDAEEKSILRSYGAGFDNPSGIAVQAETGHVFVAERRGIYRLLPPQKKADGDEKRPQRKFAEVTGFPQDVYGKGPMYDIGPLGIAFLDDEHLVVGDGSRPDGEEVVTIFHIGTEPAEQPQQEADSDHRLGPVPASEQSEKGEGNFYGVAVLDGAIYVTNNGDDTQGWISMAKNADGPLTLHIATKKAVGVDAPVAITTHEGELVVGQMGEISQPGDSLLTFYDPETGDLKAKYETGLSDIAGLAYSPVSGKLYAVDFSWHDTTQGGLFELTVADGKCSSTKIAPLDKPTALAFDAQGNLYITAFGSADEAKKKKKMGRVFRVGAKALAKAG